MQILLIDNINDTFIFIKESLRIRGQNIFKIYIIWRVGDVNDASI